MASKSGKTYTSKGIHSNVSRATRSEMKKERTGVQRMLDKYSAYLKGTNPWITIPNPDKQQTNKKFIRVRANQHWDNPKERNGFKLG